MKITTKSEINELAQQHGLSVEFDPLGPTEVARDERLIVQAPFYPFVGKRALEKTTRVISIYENRKAVREHMSSHPEVLEAAVEAALAPHEEREINGKDI